MSSEATTPVVGEEGEYEAPPPTPELAAALQQYRERGHAPAMPDSKVVELREAVKAWDRYCQLCGGDVEGWVCQTCESDFEEVGGLLLLKSDNAHATLTAALSAQSAELAKAREAAQVAAEYLCRLEGALLADDLDMKLNFPGEVPPTAMAEALLPGFDSFAYDLSRQALGETND